MRAKSAVRIGAVAVLAAAALTPTSQAASAAVAPPVAPWTVSAAVLPAGPSLPAGTYAFIRSPDNHIYMRNIAPGSQWIDTTTEAIAGSGPAVVVQPPRPASAAAKQPAKRNPFARERDGKAQLADAPVNDVYLLSTNQARNAIDTLNQNDDLSAWEPWHVLGGVYTTSIGANYDKHFSTPAEPVNFFTGRGTDGVLYLNGVNFGAQITAPPTLSYTGAYGRTALMYRGADGNLYRMLNGYNNDPYYFTAPIKIPAGPVGSSASLAERSHRYWFRGNNNRLYYENGVTWGAPVLIPTGAITGTPFALDEGIPDQPDRVNIFARGTDGKLYVYNTGTAIWTGLGGTVA